MRIGIIGTRGIPNQYGGYEQFTEFVAPALVERGHQVTVYNSSLHPYKEKSWRGVTIVSKADPEDKIGTAGQFIYDLNCIWDARKRNFDVLLQLGYTSSSVWSFLFPKSSLLVTNMDGLEWKRSKYSSKVQRFLKQAEKWAALYSDYLIADSKGIQQYLQEKYSKSSTYIAYGAQLVSKTDETIVQQRGLKKFGYNLLIARMEPENNVETVIQAHVQSSQTKPLIVIGGYNNRFGAYLKEKYSSDTIQFWGPVYDLDALNSLRYFSNLYFHGHSVGGTNPSLLEAMASYALIVAHDNVFNKAILEEDAFYFSTAEDIAVLLDQNIHRPAYEYMLEHNAQKISNQFSWNHIVNLLENFLVHALEESSSRRK